MELFFEILLQIFLELFLDLLVTLFSESLAAGLRTKSADRPSIGLLASAFAGSVLGALSVLVHAARIIQSDVFYYLSLVGNPLLVGVCLRQYGLWRFRGGRQRTYLATFWGGFVFALSFGLIRYGAQVW